MGVTRCAQICESGVPQESAHPDDGAPVGDGAGGAGGPVAGAAGSDLPVGDAPLPPPPGPPPAGHVRGRGRGRGAGVAWPTWAVPGSEGKFVLDEGRKLLGIHCPHHDTCRLNRSTEPGAKPAQGRQVAFQLAWLAAGPRFADQREHMQLSKRDMRFDADISFERRMFWRAWADSDPNLAPVLALERAPREGEGPEPATHVFTM